MQEVTNQLNERGMSVIPLSPLPKKTMILAQSIPRSLLPKIPMRRRSTTKPYVSEPINHLGCQDLSGQVVSHHTSLSSRDSVALFRDPKLSLQIYALLRHRAGLAKRGVCYWGERL